MPNIEQQQKTKTNYDTKILNNMNKHKPTIIPNFEQEEQTKSTMIPNIEQQQQTKSNYNAKY